MSDINKDTGARDGDQSGKPAPGVGQQPYTHTDSTTSKQSPLDLTPKTTPGAPKPTGGASK